MEIPIFPLPNAVLFPGTLMPLHIFEPRYRSLVAESLSADSKIGVVLLRPGQEMDGPSPPEVYSTGSVGEITKHWELEDGRYNILLNGNARFEIVAFLPGASPYRRARVRLNPELLPKGDSVETTQLDLVDRFGELIDELGTNDEADLSTLSDLEFGALVNTICMAMRMDPHQRQGLLEIDGLLDRGREVLRLLEDQIDQKRLIDRFSHLRPEDSGVN